MANAWADSMLGEQSLGIAEEVTKVAADLDTTPTAVALAWARQRPGIIGPRTTDQLDGNLAGFALDLNPETLTHLDEISAPTTTTPSTA